jgi:LacI family transcriptional regulator
LVLALGGALVNRKFSLSVGAKRRLPEKQPLCETAPVRRKEGRKPADRPAIGEPTKPVTLKMLADYVGLAPATVSLVINRSVVAENIPQRTKDLIFAAAEKLNYRPNFVARSLRTQRTFNIGVMVPEISEGYETLVISGIEDFLLQAGYFYCIVSHRHKQDLIEEYPKLLLGRSVDGIIAVDTPWKESLQIPVVTVSGVNQVAGVTNVVVDHEMASDLALRHLVQLGHRRIAFIKGQEFSSDTEARWNAITHAASRLSLPIIPALVKQLKGDTPTPELGYRVARKLLSQREPFTALFAFNDISAIGAIRALREVGLRVPEDVSVVGFDDIQSAAFQSPALTTVRQPLRKMGKVAAESVLRRISSPAADSPASIIKVAPELVVRASTAPPPHALIAHGFDSGSENSPKTQPSAKMAPDGHGNIVDAVMRETGLSQEMSAKVVEVIGRYLSGDHS